MVGPMFSLVQRFGFAASLVVRAAHSYHLPPDHSEMTHFKPYASNPSNSRCTE